MPGQPSPTLAPPRHAVATREVTPTAAPSLTGRPWVWPSATLLAQDVRATHGGHPAWIELLLERRGVTGAEAVERHLSPSLAHLEDPASMADMDTAAALLFRAVRERIPLAVYGDYDVDGVCSTALLVELLTALGADASFYIPDRRGEGYGLNEAAVRQLATRARLLVTTDCGVSANHEIAVARELGCEVIVVDHHKVPAERPAANACLDPHRPDCRFPSKVLCATGVAFMLAVALRRVLRDAGHFGAGRPEPDLRPLLDLVAVATVADMVPLTGQNRVLVAAGLRRLTQAPRVGLRALLEVSRIDGAVTAADLGFRLGPRINARGRLSHAAEAVELMLTTDAARARALAAALDQANQERRELEKRTVAAALAVVEKEGMLGDAALVIHDPSWHPGVVGLVASRLASHHHRPAVVIGEGGKGSGRSVKGLDLHAALERCSGHLVRFGGHAAAAGVTLEADRVAPFRAALDAAVREQRGAPPYPAPLEPDLAVETAALSLELVDAVQRLEPFGQENPEPLWVSASVRVVSRRIVGQDHLKLVLGNERLEAIGFGLGRLLDTLPEHVDVAYRLERNTYGGNERLVLRLEDLRPATLGG